MLFSKYYNIRRKAEDDWFDPILGTDTRLFVDPFLVFRDPEPRWSVSHRRIVLHFERAFRLIAQGNRDPKSLAYRKALGLLLFKEPKELGLGYTAEGVSGLGSGERFAQAIAVAIAKAISRGLASPRHFEELGILNEGIGRDRISDITCTVLKPELIEYTQLVARRHKIAVEDHRVYGSAFDEARQRFDHQVVRLPTNPETSGPILLVPSRFLRELPTLNADDWWNDFEDSRLRDDVNYQIMGNVSKKTIIAEARAHPEAVRSWTEQKERRAVRPYDLEEDPEGVWIWEQEAAKYTESNPLKLRPPSSVNEFYELVDVVCEQFKHFVEEEGGWKLLWDSGGKAKPESASQLLFFGIAKHYCHSNDIEISREVDLGRGPVDFKFSNGRSYRALLEVKKLDNGKYWNGLEEQLRSYMRSDKVRDGWLLTVQQSDSKLMQKRLRDLTGRVRALQLSTGLRVRSPVIDALPKKSASNL